MWPLRLVGILYLLSALWCTFQYELAAEYIGFTLKAPMGVVEFISVYGGIQFGLASAALYFSFKPEMGHVASLFALFISVALLLFRCVAMLIYGGAEGLVMMALIELLIVALLIYQLRVLGMKKVPDLVHQGTL